MEFDYALLAKYLIGSLSPEEMEEVMRWRDLSAENEVVFSEVLRLRLSWNAAKYAVFVEICSCYLAACLVFNCRMELF